MLLKKISKFILKENKHFTAEFIPYAFKVVSHADMLRFQ